MCDVCHEFHEKLAEQLDTMSGQHDELAAQLDAHINEAHATLVSQRTAQAWDKEILARVELLGEAIHGPMRDDFDGQHRDTSQGVVAKLDTVEGLAIANRDSLMTLTSGEIRTRLAVSDKVLVAVIAAIAAVASALAGG